MSIKTVIFLLVSAGIYIIYMNAIRIGLFIKSGSSIWKNFVPFISLKEEYNISGRPGWFWWHLLTMTVSAVFMAAGLLIYAQVYSGRVAKGMSEARMGSLFKYLVAISVIFYLLSLPARFAKAYGLERCFDEDLTFDYAFGIVFFTWAFKARLAFSKDCIYTLRRPAKREKKKFKLPSFFS